MDWSILRYPIRGPHAEGAFIKGLICAFAAVTTIDWFPSPLSILFVPASLLLLGYLITVQKSGLRNARSVPEFRGYARLLHRGLVGLVVALSYLALPIVMLVVTVHGASIATAQPSGIQMNITVLLGSTLVLIVLLVSAYLLPVGIVRAVENQSLLAGLHVDTVRRTAVHSRYLVAWFGGGTAIFTVLVLISELWGSYRILSVFALVVSYYALVLIAHVLGRSLRQSKPSVEQNLG
ncbi:hypothetical protein C5B86_19025 [Haloferax sp. Atlit-19N]|uniref:DUF4013 domain-containing protein n=1 Tax=Haloferax sp. Atlit-19N TaxID=2077201 RepID=UPI000E289439|nr:DUF4013 domain-containing protein [Haloferax sp. Atlit-19N]RDZ39497.1 hypothetical protein C5B86_19025 [Haloferax sp. Atlit-19N]